MKKTTLLFALLCASIIGFSQSFEGVVKVTMQALEVPADMKGYESMLKQDLTISYKPGKSKVVLKGMMGTTTVYTDSLKKEIVMLMDMMGQKIATKTALTDDSKSPASADLKGAKITKTSETKKIAGYNCKKAIAEMTDPETKKKVTIDIWYTEDLGTINTGTDISGILMEFVMETQGMKMQYLVNSLEKKEVPESEFIIPDGYTYQDMDALKGAFPELGK